MIRHFTRSFDSASEPIHFTSAPIIEPELELSLPDMRNPGLVSLRESIGERANAPTEFIAAQRGTLRDLRRQ